MSRQQKMSTDRYFIVILLFLNELSSNLVQEFKITSLFIVEAQKLLFFVIYYKPDNFLVIFTSNTC